MGGDARRGRSGFRRQRPVGRRVVLAVAVCPPWGDIFSSCGGAIDNRVPTSVQSPGLHFSQRSECSVSSSCLSRSVNSIARRRNWLHGYAPLLKQRAALFAAHVGCVCLLGGHFPWSGGEVADAPACQRRYERENYRPLRRRDAGAASVLSRR